MEPNQRNRFSFAEAASQQPERQRFSFAQNKPKRPELSSFFPAQQQIQIASFNQRNPVVAPQTKQDQTEIVETDKNRGTALTQGREDVSLITQGVRKLPFKNTFERDVIKPIAKVRDFFFPSQSDYMVDATEEDSTRTNEQIKKRAEELMLKDGFVNIDGATFSPLDSMPVSGRIKAGTEVSAGAKRLIRKILKADTPTSANKLARQLTSSEKEATEIVGRIIGANTEAKAGSLARTLQKQASTTTPPPQATPTKRFSFSRKTEEVDLGPVRDNIIRRLEAEVPVNNKTTGVGGVGRQADIINSDDITEAVENALSTLKKNPKPTMTQINDALQVLRVSGRQADDLVAEMAQVKVPDVVPQRAGASDIKPQGRFSFVKEALKNPALRQQGSIGGVPEGFPKKPQLARESVSSVDNSTNLPKIEQRFVENFPEIGSADNIAQVRSKTRGVRSNQESLDAARQLGFNVNRIRNIKEGTALNAEQKMAVSGVIESERLNLKALEEALAKTEPGTAAYNQARDAFAKQKVQLFELMAIERGVAAEAGRALQAYKSTVTAIDKHERQISKFLADPKKSQDVKDYIYKKIAEFDGTPDEMANLLRELDQASLIEMMVEFATAAKLWTPATHLVNLMSSATRMLMNAPIHSIASMFDAVISKLTGKARTRFMSDAFAEVQGQIQGWKHAGHEAAKALKDEDYAFRARILDDVQTKGPAIKGRPGKNALSDKFLNVFGKTVRIPFRLLGAEDLLLRKPSEMGAMYVALNRKARMEGLTPNSKEWNTFMEKALSDPVGEMGVDFMKEIQRIADENLFQEALHPSLKRIADIRETVPALKFIVPFFRTIVNLQKQAIQFSPMSPLLPSTRTALKAGGGPQADALAKMTLGTAVTIPLVFHALEGNITLAAPTNAAERDSFYAEGKVPYAVKIGDKWWPYQRFSPYSEWFVHAAAMGEAVNNDDEKTQTEIASHIFFTMTQNFFDKSFATGMHDFLEAMSNPERSDSWVQNFVTGATVPNFIPLAARTVDPTVRESSNLREAYISKIPYLSQTLPAKTDVFGEPITRDGSVIARAISPVIPSKIEVDIVRDELKSIGYQMGFPGKTAGGFEMEDETYRIYQSVSGKIVHKTLFQLVQSPGYQALSPRQKEKTVDKIVRDTREAVKQRVAQDQLIMQEIKNRLKDRGYSSKQSEEIAIKTFEKIKARSEE